MVKARHGWAKYGRKSPPGSRALELRIHIPAAARQRVETVVQSGLEGIKRSGAEMGCRAGTKRGRRR